MYKLKNQVLSSVQKIQEYNTLIVKGYLPLFKQRKVQKRLLHSVAHKNVNIYEFNYTAINEKDWVAAQDIREAMRLLADEMPNEVSEMDDGITIKALSEEDWDKNIVTNDEYDDSEPESEENWKQMTFREYVKGATTSQYIAGTMNE